MEVIRGIGFFTRHQADWPVGLSPSFRDGWSVIIEVNKTPEANLSRGGNSQGLVWIGGCPNLQGYRFDSENHRMFFKRCTKIPCGHDLMLIIQYSREVYAWEPSRFPSQILTLQQILEQEHMFCGPMISVLVVLRASFRWVDCALVWSWLACQENSPHLSNLCAQTAKAEFKLTATNFLSPLRYVFVRVVSFHLFFTIVLLRWPLR